MMEYGLDSRSSITARGKRFFWTPQCADGFWSPLRFLSNGYCRLFPGANAARAQNSPLTSI
jgi:hypothetical protein